jgi:hypothetical protein
LFEAANVELVNVMIRAAHYIASYSIDCPVFDLLLCNIVERYSSVIQQFLNIFRMVLYTGQSHK